jgi:hypothetical protein
MDECLRLTQQVKNEVRRLTKKVKAAANLVQDDFNPPPLSACPEQNPFPTLGTLTTDLGGRHDDQIDEDLGDLDDMDID